MNQKRLLFLLAIAFLGLLITHPISVQAEQVSPTSPLPSSLKTSILYIEQASQPSTYTILSGSEQIWFTPQAIWFTFLPDTAQPGQGGVHIRASFSGANPDPIIETRQPVQGQISRLIGNDPANWQTNQAAWKEITYRAVYPGVDLSIQVLPDGNLSWQFLTQPGADLSSIKMQIEGAEQITRRAGTLQLDTKVGSVNLPLPAIRSYWQGSGPAQILQPTAAGTGFEIPRPYQVNYSQNTGRLLADRSDRMIYATLLGGSQWDHAYSVAVDSSGNTYIAGTTPSTDFPITPGAFDSSIILSDAFVAKINAAGSELIFSTYLGGDGMDRINGIALNGGNIHLVGETSSADFPGGGASAGEYDSFVTALDATGSSLLFSRLLGGTDSDFGNAIAVENGISFITGMTQSTDFPIEGVEQDGDIFIARYDANGNRTYGRVIGGRDTDSGLGITVRNGLAVIVGETYSPDFPASGYKGNNDVAVLHLASNGTVSAAKLIGGTGNDVGLAIAQDSTGQLFLTGQTNSTDFPVTEGSHQGGMDAFLVKLSSTDNLLYAAYLGGMGEEAGRSIALDSQNGINLAGFTTSSTFPVTADAFQSTLFGSSDGFVTRFDLNAPDTGHRTFSSYIGGNSNDEAFSLSVDADGFVYICGYTQSADFPTTSGVFSQSLHGSSDAFLAKLAIGPIPAIQIEKFTNGIDVDTLPGPYILAGQTVTWTYQVTNTGRTALSQVAVTDNPSQTISCPKTSLAEGESMTCSASKTASAGQYTNTATANGTSPLGKVVSDQDSSYYFGAQPAITVEKRVNGLDADSAPGPYIPTGQTVNWTFLVSNTGNVALSSINLTDNQGVSITCPKTSLQPGEQMTCTGSSTAAAGQHQNQATASGTPPGGLTSVSAVDPAYYFGSSPAVDLIKKTNTQDANTAPGVYIPVGNAVTWSYAVNNTGNVSLSNVTVRDDNGTPANSGDDVVVCVIANLAAGATQNCTRNGTAGTGQYGNIGTVTATPPVGNAVTDSDPSYYFGAAPALYLRKQINNQDADAVPGVYVLTGSTVNFQYIVQNTGNVSLSSVAVSDNPAQTISCPKTSLSAGESMTCTSSRTAAAGQYTSTASASGTPPGGLSSAADTDPANYFGTSLSLSLVYKTNNQDANTPPGPSIVSGAAVSWSYAVTNNSNVALTNLAVRDDNGTPANPADDVTVCNIPSLAVGALQTCTRDGTAKTGQYASIASVSGTPPGGLSNTAASDPSHYFGAAPAVSLVKRTNGQDANAAPGPTIVVGQPVTWTYEVTNTGNVALSSILVKDNNGTPANTGDDLTVCTIPSLSPAASQTCTLIGTAAAGQYVNQGFVSATPSIGSTVTASDLSHYYGAPPGMLLIASVNGQDANDPPGLYILADDPITWTYSITNTGEVNLLDLAIQDDNGTPANPADDIAVCEITNLAPSATQQCQRSGTAQLGQYNNLATASATVEGGSSLTVSDPAYYYGSQPAITLTLKANDSDANTPTGPYILAGQPVNWTYLVTNTGNVPVAGITVTDDNGTPAIPGDDLTVCTITSLSAGDTETCTRSSLANAGQQAHQAALTGTPPVGSNLTAVDSANYFGALVTLTLDIKTNGQDAAVPPGLYLPVGSQVAWTYTASNTGNVTLTNLSVVDDNSTPANPADDATICSIASLAPGGSQVCTRNGTAIAGQYANSAATSASPPGGLSPITASDKSHYFGAAPSILLIKRTNGQDANSAPGVYLLTGSSVSWTYEVTNTGNVTLTDVSVTDNPPAALTCPKTSLAAGESMTCTASATASAGQFSNTATASGTPPGGLLAVNDTDTSHYFGTSPGISLDKKTNGQDAPSTPGVYIPVGSAVTWTYTVSNTGNVALSSISIRDDNGTPGTPADDFVVCSISSLAVGASQTCPRNGTAASGQYTNHATASASPPGGLNSIASSDQSNYYGANPALVLVKKVNGQDANTAPGPSISAGSTINWSYEVSNTGNVILNNVTITDDNGTPSNPADDFTVCVIAALNPGANQTCLRSGTAQAGLHTSIASAAGTPPGGLSPASDTDPCHYFGEAPAVQFIKRTNGQDANIPPGPTILTNAAVTWTYEITNTGNVTLSNLVVRDDNGTPGTSADDFTVCTLTSLAPLISQTCTKSGTAINGQYTNMAALSATSPLGTAISASDPSSYYGAPPGLRIKLSTNGQDANDPPGVYIPVGNPVNWSYEITNTGQVEITNLTITDDNGTSNPNAVSVCTITSLAPAAVQTCTRSGTAAAGQFASHAAALGTLPGGSTISASDPSHYFGSLPSVSLIARVNSQDANTAPGLYILAGSPLAWSYQASNTGNVPLTNLVITDDNGTPGNPADDLAICTITSLAAGQVQTCTRNSSAPVGALAVTASLTAAPPTGGTITTSDPVNLFGVILGLSLETAANGADADTVPGPYIPAGSPVSWTYTLTNNSNVGLTSVAVSDSQGVTVTCPKNTLDILEQMICTASGSAAAGQYSNTGTASGTPPGGLATVSASDPSHYFGSQPGLSLVKRINNQDVNVPDTLYVLSGSSLAVTYQVSNTGNVTLSNLQVSDDNGTPSDPADDLSICSITSLQPAASQTCSMNQTAASGSSGSTGQVSGTPPVGSALQASDPAYYFGAVLSLALEKSTNGEDADGAPGPSILAGDPVTWTYLITNNSNVTLSSLSLIDDQEGTVSCPQSSLAAGGQMTCLLDGTASAGQYTNQGTIQGTPPGGLNPVQASDLSHYLGYTLNPALDLELLVNGQDADTAPGMYILSSSPITWTYRVTNIGDAQLNNVIIRDDGGTPSYSSDDLTICTIDTLEVLAQQSCTRNSAALEGYRQFIASVEGTALNLETVSDSDPGNYFGAAPALTLSIRTNDELAESPPGPSIRSGEIVHWAYTVTNTGNVTLTNIGVVDDAGTSADPSDDQAVCVIGSLSAGSVAACAWEDTAGSGPYVNQAHASGLPPGGLASVEANAASHYFGADLTLSLAVSINDESAAASPGPLVGAGEIIQWRYTVTNQGNVTLEEISLRDDNGTSYNPDDDLEICTIGSLSPGQSQTCTRSSIASLDLVTHQTNAQSIYGPYLVTAQSDSYYTGENRLKAVFLPFIKR